jgi:hypothetical protein
MNAYDEYCKEKYITGLSHCGQRACLPEAGYLGEAK